MAPPVSPWTLSRDDFDVVTVLHRDPSCSISVIIPARNEAPTVGGVIDAVVDWEGLCDEVIVVDDASRDGTGDVAREHGARVIRREHSTGKGGAMRAGVQAARGEIVVFLDADVLNMRSDFVARLVYPLIANPSVQLVKPFYIRPLHQMPHGGGRVNELVARPLLSLLSPGLEQVRQPLAGESALRRSILRRVELAPAYGVEIALLIDVARHWGLDAVAQVDLGIRRHRNRPLSELRPMSEQIMRVALRRYGIDLPIN
ncbi:MAG: glucosyl-3-phosphoglycerate synthase [Acidimicrobiaceae bacterium]|nr:glucosyl-3-phosphoglycerate synthase [Acidimicrobiaceae bacterium]